MTFDDYCKFAIQEHPTLYAKDTEDSSKFSAAHQAFVVLGNGMEWAQHIAKSGKVTELGYLTHPRYKRAREDSYRRLPDPPYGQPAYTQGDQWKSCIGVDFWSWGIMDDKPGASVGASPNKADIPERYNPDELIALRQSIRKLRGESPNKVKSLIHRMSSLMSNSAQLYKLNETYKEDGRTLHMRKHREHPYPNFSKQYLPAWELEPTLMQSDWRLAMLEHYRYWRTYFDGPDPKCHVATAKEYGKHWKGLEVADVRARWEVPVWNGNNLKEAQEYLRTKYLNEVKVVLDETIARLDI